MKIKKYIGHSEYEVMNKLKKELGSDAIIVNTKSVRQKGILGFFKKPFVEITAAYEKDKKQNKQETTDNNIVTLNNELVDLKKMIKQISANFNNHPDINPKLNEFWLRLIDNGVEESIATTILKNLDSQVNLESKDNITIKKIIGQTLIEHIGKPNPLELDEQDQKIVFFLGPTGVGKTTSLAKIAAQLILEEQYDIGLVTCDTYRIAAIEQLKTYSDILKAPLEIVYNEQDIYKVLAKFKEKDVILVDTSGRNHREINENDELFSIINSVRNSVIYLVLSGTTDFLTLKSIVEHYDFVKDYSMIFTKLDETERLGNLLNVKFLTDKPISYVTTGQNVPDDIDILNQTKLVSQLLEEIGYERSGGKTKKSYEFQKQ